jgi:hypothetical protein
MAYHKLGRGGNCTVTSLSLSSSLQVPCMTDDEIENLNSDMTYNTFVSLSNLAVNNQPIQIPSAYLNSGYLFSHNTMNRLNSIFRISRTQPTHPDQVLTNKNMK